MKKLVGPFKEILPLDEISFSGTVPDADLRIVKDGGLVIEKGQVVEIGSFDKLREQGLDIEEIAEDLVVLPGFIDCHTHMCWGGTRAQDYALRTSGATYQEILARKGGIHETVRKTRAANEASLAQDLSKRLERHLQEGVTTVEVKSGYGLNVEDELKMLRVVTNSSSKVDIIPTCLAAHVCPEGYQNNEEYLAYILSDLLPLIKEQGLANRVDIFVEDNAFRVEESYEYLQQAQGLGFDITVHADQFTTGGSELAVKCNALSADHLENSGDTEIEWLANSSTVGVVLPGASLGLGMQFAPARRLLDRGVCLAIASDWNPGSAPMGDLLTESALLGAYEKLSAAEIFSGLTFRAASALGLTDRGRLVGGMHADFIAFPTKDYREILWHQGKMKPSTVWKNGEAI